MIFIYIFASFVAGVFACKLVSGTSKRELLTRNLLCNRWLDDRNTRYLNTLRRELCNFMIKKDAKRFNGTYDKAYECYQNIKSFDADDRKKLLSGLVVENSSYEDFDLPSCKEFVLYEDALSNYSYEEIESHYIKIIKFQLLSQNNDHDFNSIIKEQDVHYAEEYTRRVNDSLFQCKLKKAISRFYYNQDKKKETDYQFSYDDEDFMVEYIPHFAETRIGVKLKKTEEYGIYGSFVSDDASDEVKIYESFYRSSWGFNTEKVLDTNDSLETC